MSSRAERKRNILDSVGSAVGGVAKTAHSVIGGAVDAMARSGGGDSIVGSALQPLLRTEGYKDLQEERSFRKIQREEAKKNFAHDDWKRAAEKEIYAQGQEDRQRHLKWTEEDRVEAKADRQQKREWATEDRAMQVESNRMALQRQRIALDAARADRKQQEIQVISGNVRSRLWQESQDWNSLTPPEQDAFLNQNGPAKEYLEALWGARNLMKARDGDEQAWEDVTRELEEAGIGVVEQDGDYFLVIEGEQMPLNEDSVMAAVQHLEGAVAGELQVAAQIGTLAGGGFVMNGVMRDYVSEFAKYNGGVLTAAQKSFSDAYGQLTPNEKIYMALGKMADVFDVTTDDDQKISLANQATPLLERLGVELKMRNDGEPYIFDEREAYGRREYSISGFGQILKQLDTGTQKLQSALQAQQKLYLQQEAAKMREAFESEEPLSAAEQATQYYAELGAKVSENDKSLDGLYQIIAEENIKGKEISRDDINAAVGVAISYALKEGGEDPQMIYKLYSNKLRGILGDMGIRVPKNFASEHEEKFLRNFIMDLNKKIIEAKPGDVESFQTGGAAMGIPMLMPDKDRQELRKLHNARKSAIKRLKKISGNRAPVNKGDAKRLETKKALFGL